MGRNSRIKLIEDLWSEFDFIENQIYFWSVGTLEIRFESSSIDLLFVVWALKADWLGVKYSMLENIKLRFDEEGIEIPFPHLSLYTGSVTEPVHIRIIEKDSQ